MRYRPLGRTGWNVSEISFGAWAIGGSWGPVDDRESMAALNAAVDAGVNFIDTADVYGTGRSERLIARLKSERREEIIVATKAGRRLPAQATAWRAPMPTWPETRWSQRRRTGRLGARPLLAPMPSSERASAASSPQCAIRSPQLTAVASANFKPLAKSAA